MSEAKPQGRTELPKSYDPQAVEPTVRRRWEEHHPFHAEPSDPGEPYCIVIPPPNVTGGLHLGHALNNTLQDVLIRFHRMKGFNTLWMPGTDHAGIATQTAVDKRLHAEGRPSLKDYKRLESEGKDGREQFVAKVQAWKDEYEATIIEQLKLMGCSCDWQRTRFTMDEMCARAVREAFFQLFKAGLIYRGKRLVNWDPATQTALADDEVEMEEIDGHFWYLKYPIVESVSPRLSRGATPDEVAETGDFVIVATTRPETMLGDTAVAVNPNDPQRAHFIGKHVRLPIVNRIVPIVGDDYVVIPDPESSDPKAKYASGFLKVTPGHDPNDWEIGLRHNLPVINVLAPDGTISSDHGWPAEDFARADADGVPLGLDRFEAREVVVEWFRRNGLLADVKPYRHSVGHSYRSHVPIEPYLSDQWYVKVASIELAGNALRALSFDQRSEFAEPWWLHRDEEPDEDAEPWPYPRTSEWEGRLRHFPNRYARTFENWHLGIKDWCISRQLWWGHRIPIWSIELTRNGYLAYLARFWPSLATSLRIPDDIQGTPADERALATLNDVKQANADKIALSRPLRRQFDPMRGSISTADRSKEIWFEIPDSEVTSRERDSWRLSTRVDLCVGAPDDALLRQLETVGFVRDPDVLDTWFSSALWPMSTMGWPDPEAFAETAAHGGAPNLLDRFNPTDVLCTAREIITLWVSRMVMFNTFFLDRLPFRDVFIHAMIQDGEGRKMSKSLGNGVDPRDIIRSRGADAMRFTLVSMTTQTQDVRMPVEYDASIGANTSPKFELGGRLCNKVWNATRFALGILNNAEHGLPARTDEPEHGLPARTDEPEHGLPARANGSSQRPRRLIDRWILSRLARTVRQIEEAVREYEFNFYAQSMYDLFWRDLCDWYLEGIKPTVREDATQQRILRAALGAVQRMFHPIIPFVTEALHESIESLPVAPIEGVDLPPSDLAARARWPVVDEALIDEEAQREFARVQALVSAIREVRSQQKVHDRRLITLRVADDATMRLIEAAEGVVEALAGLGSVDREAASGDGGVGARGPTASFIFEGVEHALAELTESVDMEAERERLSRQRGEVEKRLNALRGRLANPSYTQKAPAHLVEETRRQLAEAEAELTGILQGLEKVQG